MELIKNIQEGACTSIVFWQFTHSCGALTFEDIQKFASTLPEDDKYYSTINLTLEYVKPVILKHWNAKNWKLLPNGRNQIKLKECIPKLTYYGKTEYGNIAVFNRCIEYLMTGIWIEFDIDDLNDGKTLRVNKDMFNKYTEFMRHFVTNVPYMSSVVFIGEDGKYEDEMHIAFVLKNNKYYEIYDSNLENINYVVDFPAIIETDGDYYYKVLVKNN
jgi:hypothetical protein